MSTSKQFFFSGMTADRPTLSTALRYALFQLPGIAFLGLCLLFLDRWPGIPRWLSWGAFAGWIVKDTLLFPLLWRSYDLDREGRTNSMVGDSARVLEILDPAGRVSLRGELWHAEPAEGFTSIEAGMTVRVVGMRGLTLLVEPEGEAERTFSHS